MAATSILKAESENKDITKLYMACKRLMERIVLGRLKCVKTEIQEQRWKGTQIRIWTEKKNIAVSFCKWDEHYSY